MLVTIDGPNGVGKTTVVDSVARELTEANIDVYVTSEPSRSKIGGFIRELENEFSGITYACLVAADRYNHLNSEIIPAIQQDKVVLSARYVESSLVLQRIDGVDIDFIWRINSKILTPDISVILIASVETLNERLSLRSSYSRFELQATRQMEIDYYLEAKEFLSEKGYNTMILENDTTSVTDNVRFIVNSIITTRSRKRSV